jgi:hypothetical protein
MVTALVLLLLVRGAPCGAQEATAARELVLPDVTLSAEDPLFLAIPAAMGWALEAPEQPPPDRRRLWAAEVPPRIRALQALPPLPDSAPGGSPGSAAGLPGVQPGAVPAASGATPGLQPGPSGAGAGAAGRASEAGLRVLYHSTTTAGIDLWLDRRWSAWETSAGSSLTFSGEIPSSLELRAAAAWQRAAWHASLQGDGAGMLRPQSSGFLAGGLSAKLRRDPAPFGLELAARLLAEQPAEEGDAWLLLSQGLAGSWQGEHWALRAGGLGFAAMGENPTLHGLARFELEWAATALTISAGAALLASEAGLRPYPEGSVELRPSPTLRLQAGLAAYLEQPLPFLAREAFGGGERPALLPPAGLKARLSAMLEAPRTGSIVVGLQAFNGERLLLRDGLLYLVDDPHLSAEVLARLALNPEARRLPALTLTAGGDAGIPLPVSAQAFDRPLYGGLSAGLRIGFAKWPAELILQARRGDVPGGDLAAWLAERRAAGWLASLAVRWEVRPPLTVEGGLEAGAGLGGLAGCTLQTRRSP